MKEQSSFFQQSISLIGLIVSFTAAITPLFNKGPISNFFIDNRVTQPISFLILVVGVAVVWYFTQISTSPTFNIWQKKDKQYGFLTGHYVSITTNGFIKIAISIVVVSGILFIALYDFADPNQHAIGFIQSVSYLIMFLALISLLALLYAQTKAQHMLQDIMERFPLNVLETLNKYKLVNSGIEISHNEVLSADDLRNLKLDPNQYMWSKKIKVKTVNQQEKAFTLIVDYAGTQLFKILKVSGAEQEKIETK